MSAPAQAALLADGRRLHLQQGPIDLIIAADGADGAVTEAYHAATRRFTGLLDELCDELPLLRRAASLHSAAPDGAVARRMLAAVLPYAERCFITPMAAVAGAVADELLAAMRAAAPLDRAYVNNGGDIALALAPGQQVAVGIVDRLAPPRLAGRARVTAADGVGGIATSGCGGRSFSLGIADAVTILAGAAAAADAAATVVANDVNLPGHPAVQRVAARACAPDSDLGDRLVTRRVGALAAAEIDQALAAGVSCAAALLSERRIQAAALFLRGRQRHVTRIADDFYHSLGEEAPCLPL